MFKGCTFLAFHQTSDKFYPGINNIRPERFWPLLRMIEGWGFSFYGGQTTEDIHAAKKLVITFDDGYCDQYEILIRLLDTDIRPMLFIPAAYIGQSNLWEYSSRLFPARHLDAGQIAKLADVGVIIGSHGWSHRSLAAMNPDEAHMELRRSKETLEDITGRPVEYISFPFGRSNSVINEAARHCGYKRGFTLGRPGHLSEPNQFLLPRIPVYGIDDYYSVRGKLAGESRLERLKNRIINHLAGGTIFTSGRLK